ncbi:MAG: pyridoxamine 5'-phosphate oxidase family protein, partial [Acidobacteria bacterium]|nr:pyridoxamine 5'-phosphate oxidase family protein [Acidobacteriota bacterium]
ESITAEQARRFLDESLVAHIGVISVGEPYVTPMSFVVDSDRILFRTKPGKRYEAMLENPVVSIEASTFDNETGDWTSVIVRGRAAEADDATITLTVQLLLRKYGTVLGPLLSRGHVVEVTIDEITGMISGGGFAMRTRPGRL